MRVGPRWFRQADRGAVLPIVASMLILLLGSAAFATDIGWLYVNTARIQRAADAAALAGVIHMPADFPQSSQVALDVAEDNGFADTSMGGSATVTPEEVPDYEERLKVTVEDPVDTFFLRLFGMSSVSISRSATAEYVLPLPLGSPLDYLGNDPEAGQWPNFWVNIHGKYTDRVMGDAFSPFCDSQEGGGNDCDSQFNPEYRGEEVGYVYAVEVPSGVTGLQVQVFHGPFVEGGDDHFQTGDHNICGGCDPPPNPENGPRTEFTLYEADDTPLVWSDNPVICTRVFESVDEGEDEWLWRDICPPLAGAITPGIYPLRVRIGQEDFGDVNEMGLNRFSLRALRTSGPIPNVHGFGDMSIFNNSTSSVTNFYLAEVDPVHAGKDLVIELYDPGDADSGHIKLLDPWDVSPSCTVEVPPGDNLEVTEGCKINTTRPTYNYNGDWVKVTVALPVDYGVGGCPPLGCWWTVDYEYPAGTQDTTTWRAYVIGNPVHLVHEDP